MASGISHTTKAIRSGGGASRTTPNFTSSKGFERKQNSCSMRAIVSVLWRKIRQRCWENDNPTALIMHVLNAVVMRSDSVVTCDYWRRRCSATVPSSFWNRMKWPIASRRAPKLEEILMSNCGRRFTSEIETAHEYKRRPLMNSGRKIKYVSPAMHPLFVDFRNVCCY